MILSGPWTRLRLAPSAESGSTTRAELRRLLEDAGVESEVRETAVLLASEMVSNAVEHGGGPSYLDAAIRPDVLRLEVSDPSPELPAPAGEVDEVSERGRGLMLIAALSSRWGAERRRQGKTVWCEIALA